MPNSSQKRALIVENEPEDQKKISARLEARSIKCDVAISALKAHTKLKEREYALVILDLDLGSGSDEGKFLLDTMLQEGLHRPTIIVSHAGLLPETIALKGKYDFIKESIDKSNLYTLLDVFDKAVREILNSNTSSQQTSRTSGGLVVKEDAVAPAYSLWGTLLVFLIAFLIIIGAIALISNLVSPWLFGFVMIATILVFLLLAATMMMVRKDIHETGYLEIIERILKSLPLLRNISPPKKIKKP